MSTAPIGIPDAPATRVVDGIYAGTDMRLGEKLNKMYRDGRHEVRRQITRWQRNRAFFRGDQWVTIRGGRVRSLAPADMLPDGRRRETVNRSRSFIEGRTALLTHQRPPYRVLAPSGEYMEVEAARLAENVIEANWDNWDIDHHRRSKCLAGEIDGMVFTQVILDRELGDTQPVPVDKATGQPIMDDGQLEAYQDQDPEGKALWEYVQVPKGDIKLRVIRPGYMSVDPFCSEKWDDVRWVIETRVRPVADVEAQFGIDYKALKTRSDMTSGITNYSSRTERTPAVTVEDQDGQQRLIASGEAVKVHEMFHVPGGDFPRGAHIRWIESAPEEPLSMEPWEDELPVRPYIPKPDGGHILRSRGTMDDLVPLQTLLNRTITQYAEYIDLVARPILVTVHGGLRPETKEVFNPKRIVSVNPGPYQPSWLTAPSEPAQLLQMYVPWLLQQMGEIAVQSAAARGHAPGHGVEAASAVNMLIEQSEQQLSGTEAELIASDEWELSRALDLVGKHFDIPRLMVTPGTDELEEMRQFTGAMLKGANQFRVIGSVLPRSRQAETQMIMAMAQATGGKVDLSKYVGSLVRGDTQSILAAEDAQEKAAKRIAGRIYALGTHPERDQIMEAFQEAQMGYFQALEKAKVMAAEAQQATEEIAAPEPGEMQVPGLPAANVGQRIDPLQILASAGIEPPTLARLTQDMGLVPTVADWNRPAEVLWVLDRRCMDAGFEKTHPIVQQAMREVRNGLQQRIAMQYQSLLAQHTGPASGSTPKELGEPSPPAGAPQEAKSGAAAGKGPGS